MAVTLYPALIDVDRHAAIKRSERTLTLYYVGEGDAGDDHNEVVAAVNTQTPTEIGGELIRNDADIEYLGGINCTLWRVSVKFVHPEHEDNEEEQDENDGDQISFDTGGGTIHVDVARHTDSWSTVYAESVHPPDFKDAINVRDDAVEGTDIVAPALRFQITRVLPASVVTLDYVRTLSELTGTVNSGTFKGFAQGEVLFLGAQGSQRQPRRDGGAWDITFSFETSSNEDNLPIGGITVTKEGWQYLWVAFRDQEDTEAKALVRRPIGVYVQDVYKKTNFSALGIGT